ncbi:MAG: TonB-dependent receptor [Polyangiaceae bacterium]|nr:TonB-dependent receptor [Polyangiaceae bacterium]
MLPCPRYQTVLPLLLCWGFWAAGVRAEVVAPRVLAAPPAAWPSGKAEAHDVVVPVVLTVTAEGVVSDVEIEASVGGELDAAAVEAARRWTFQPALQDGRPVAAKVRAIVRFLGALAARGSRESKPTAGPHGANAGTDDMPRQPNTPSADAPAQPIDVEVLGERVAPPRSASEVTRTQAVIQAAPHRTGGDLLQIVPGVFITQHSGQGKAYQVFYRGFDAVHGQDLEFSVGGAPVNEVSNIHGQGYADLHFVMPEVVSRITVLPGNYSPEQGDFAVAGSIRYDLGYREPGVTAKGTLGSFGERRVFLAYHPADASPRSFAAFEAQATDGFGPARAARRTSAIAQQLLRAGDGQLRLLATGYAGRFDSPGVVRLRDIETGAMGRLDTYGVNQGGFSSRYQLVAEYSGSREGAGWTLAPYAVWRALELKQNYTGSLIDESNGDTAQLINDSMTLGAQGRYRRPVHWLSEDDAIEAGMSVRNDWVDQSQLDIGADNGRVLATIVDATIRAMDAAGWVDLAVVPVQRLKARLGLRVDGLAYDVQDQTPASEARAGADPNAFARQLRPPSPGGQARTAMGAHYGPRVTLDGSVATGLHALLSYGEGFRSPQARSLGDGERTPFTTVRCTEAGVRYAGKRLGASLSAFRTTLTNDLVFDAATTRNESVPPSQRVGGALEFVVRADSRFISSGSATWTRATFTQSDRQFQSGDRLPYVPELIIREDLAFTPVLATLAGRTLQGRLGAALTGMFNRPQPYGEFGHDVLLIDLTTELRLKEMALGVDVFNVLGARWYDSEFTYSANWNPGTTPRLVPERYVTVGAPRTLLGTLSLFLD